MDIDKWDAYKRWSAAQPCVDCGRLKHETPGLEWCTESQCWDCYKALGTPESRGLPGAEELFLDAGGGWI